MMHAFGFIRTGIQKILRMPTYTFHGVVIVEMVKDTAIQKKVKITGHLIPNGNGLIAIIMRRH